MRRGLSALMTVGAVTALGATPAAASLTPVPDGPGSAQNVSTIMQAPNAAGGGDATATGGNGGDASTGDTSAKSGDANGGDGGNAKASGGDAKAVGGDPVAGNIAKVLQRTAG